MAYKWERGQAALERATDFEVKSVSVSCLETITTARFNDHWFEKLSEKFLLKTFFHLPVMNFSWHRTEDMTLMQRKLLTI